MTTNAQRLVSSLLHPGSWRWREALRLSMSIHRVRTFRLHVYLDALWRELSTAPAQIYIRNESIFVLGTLLVVPMLLCANSELALLEKSLVTGEIRVEVSPFEVIESAAAPFPDTRLDRVRLLKEACAAFLHVAQAVGGPPRALWYIRREVRFFCDSVACEVDDCAE
jgi:hypothetical protein